MKTGSLNKPRKLLAVSSAVVGALASPQMASAQIANGPEVLACFYECKPTKTRPGVVPTSWMETTTLMVANENPPVVGPTGAHLVTHVAHLLFVDGNEKEILHTRTALTGWDLDEIHVCRTLNKNGVAPPPAGLVQIGIEPVTAAEYFGGVDVWIKNLLGKFSFQANDPFVSGSVTSLGKTNCNVVPPEVAGKSFGRIMNSTARVGENVLIERTQE